MERPRLHLMIMSKGQVRDARKPVPMRASLVEGCTRALPVRRAPGKWIRRQLRSPVCDFVCACGRSVLQSRSRLRMRDGTHGRFSHALRSRARLPSGGAGSTRSTDIPWFDRPSEYGESRIKPRRQRSESASAVASMVHSVVWAAAVSTKRAAP